ncbi:MAG: hypothetical protein SGCHY_005444, partial [Lobulomycetales sp.]
IQQSGSCIPRVVLATLLTLSDASIAALREAFEQVVDVAMLRSQDQENLQLLGREELDVTFTKLHCWNLDEYDLVTFLDADTLIVQNIDDIFDHVHGDSVFAAAPDIGWPDCFNSGVFVLKPSREMYRALCQFASESGSFDGGDQGLLNSFFSTWSTGDRAAGNGPPPSSRLPFTYNVTPSATYSYLPAYMQFFKDIRVIHFIGAKKPWNFPRYSDGTIIPDEHTGKQIQYMIQKWWTFYEGYFKKKRADMEKQTTSTNPPQEFPMHRPHSASRGRTHDPSRALLPKGTVLVPERVHKSPLKRQKSPARRESPMKNIPDIQIGRSASPPRREYYQPPVVPKEVFSKKKDNSRPDENLNTTTLLNHRVPHLLYDNLYTFDDSTRQNEHNIQVAENDGGFVLSARTSSTDSTVETPSDTATPRETGTVRDKNEFSNYRVDWDDQELKVSVSKIKSVSSLASLATQDSTFDDVDKYEEEAGHLDDRIFVEDEESDEGMEFKLQKVKSLRSLRTNTAQDSLGHRSTAEQDAEIISPTSPNGSTGVLFKESHHFGVGGSNFLESSDDDNEYDSNLSVMRVEIQEDWMSNPGFAQDPDHFRNVRLFSHKTDPLNLGAKESIKEEPGMMEREPPVVPLLYAAFEDHSNVARAAESTVTEMNYSYGEQELYTSRPVSIEAIEILRKSRSYESFFPLVENLDFGGAERVDTDMGIEDQVVADVLNTLIENSRPSNDYLESEEEKAEPFQLGKYEASRLDLTLKDKDDSYDITDQAVVGIGIVELDTSFLSNFEQGSASTSVMSDAANQQLSFVDSTEIAETVKSVVLEEPYSVENEFELADDVIKETVGSLPVVPEEAVDPAEDGVDDEVVCNERDEAETTRQQEESVVAKTRKKSNKRKNRGQKKKLRKQKSRQE